MSQIKTQTAVVAQVAASATVVTLFTAQAGGNKRIIFNDASTAMYVKFGAAASLTDWTYKIAIGAAWDVPTPLYSGLITAIWDTGPTGQARITSY